MSISKIVGRKEELAVLERVVSSPDPEFLAVYGRRRVGKTHLIREFFGDMICFEITGMYNASLTDQLTNFSRSLGKAAGMVFQPQRPASWAEAFLQLEQFLESIQQKEIETKHVIFLDELPWLNTPRSKFISAFEHFWNTYGSRQNNLVLIVCGSAASWMIQNIVRSKGGLHNRLTRQIRLLPFTLSETEEFLQKRGINLTRFQIIELYMVMGGVPFYLMQADPGMSAAQIIDKVCFTTTGLLRNEYEKLYSSLFENSEAHLKIVSLLAQKQGGLSRNELLAATKFNTEDTLTKVMEALEESGFIESRIPFRKKVNDSLYRISDEFTLFYFAWIKNLGKKTPGSGYWMSRQSDPKRLARAGYAFESICLKHVQQMKTALGITLVEISESQ